MFTDYIALNAAATKFCFCSPFGLFTLHSGRTPPRCTGGLHEEAWHVTVASASCDVVQTHEAPLSKQWWSISPSALQGLQTCADASLGRWLQLWISPMKSAHGECLIIRFTNALIANKWRDQYLICSVLFGATIWMTALAGWQQPCLYMESNTFPGVSGPQDKHTITRVT